MVWTSSFSSLCVQDYIHLITYYCMKYQFDKFNKTRKRTTHEEVCWQYLYLTTLTSNSQFLIAFVSNLKIDNYSPNFSLILQLYMCYLFVIVR